MKYRGDSKSFVNKKARFDYQISDQFESGIVLNGLEIKAVRAGRINLTGSYAKVISNEVFWLGGEIGVKEGDSQRTRKLLLKRPEIDKISGSIAREKLSLVPIKLYVKRGKAKLLLGLAKGKKSKDKREMIKNRDLERENARIAKIS